MVDIVRPASFQYFSAIGAKATGQNFGIDAQAVPLIHTDSQSLSDPAQLARVLLQMNVSLRTALTLANSNPLANAFELRDVPMTAGNTAVLNHGLGRVARFEAINPRGASWDGFAQSPQPTGLDTTTQIAIVSNNTGTYDFRFY